MGNIRPSFIKIRALRLIERYPDQFTSDFDENKTVSYTHLTLPTNDQV